MKNQQKWLTKKIPKEWMDKDGLLELLIFECLVHFVEDEKGLRDSDYDWDAEFLDGYVTQEYMNRLRSRNAELWHCYHYIKLKRPMMVDNLDKTDDFRAYERLEKELYDEDSFIMDIIIKNRGYLWT
jgi:hypothetical protein